MKKSILVDYSNTVHRCIHAADRIIRDRIGKFDDFDTDETTIYNVFKKLLFSELVSHVEKFQPTRVVIALDSTNFWRKTEIYPEYKGKRKAQREDSTVDYDVFFPIANAFLEELKPLLSSFYFIQVDRMEADDIIAILARKFDKNNEEVVIISTDGDLRQLCSSNVSQYDPKKREFLLVTDPKKELAIKCIEGDKGDNIGNILSLDPTKYPVEKKIGVGPVLAEKILKEEDFIASKMVIDKVQKKYTNLSTITIKEEIKKNYDRNVALIDLSRIPFEYEQAILDCYANYKVSPINLMELNRFATRIGANEFVEKFYVFQNVLKNLNKIEDDLVS